MRDKRRTRRRDASDGKVAAGEVGTADWVLATRSAGDSRTALSRSSRALSSGNGSWPGRSRACSYGAHLRETRVGPTKAATGILRHGRGSAPSVGGRPFQCRSDAASGRQSQLPTLTLCASSRLLGESAAGTLPWQVRLPPIICGMAGPPMAPRSLP
jgi:hypothetical protein